MDYDFSGLNDDQVAWIKDLLTTDAAQTIGTLESYYNGGFCCLGRACAVLNTKRIINENVILYDGETALLSSSETEKMGLNTDDGGFDVNKLVAEDQNAVDNLGCLTELNDILEWSFKQIGEFILRNKTAVFKDNQVGKL